MGIRKKQDPNIMQVRVENDLRVIKYCRDNISTLGKGRLRSPSKLMVFYAGYTAMRSLWEVKTNRGDIPTGDPELEKDFKNPPAKFIFRVEKEIVHSIGEHSDTLLRVRKFKYWADKFLTLYGT